MVFVVVVVMALLVAALGSFRIEIGNDNFSVVACHFAVGAGARAKVWLVQRLLARSCRVRNGAGALVGTVMVMLLGRPGLRFLQIVPRLAVRFAQSNAAAALHAAGC